MLEYRMQKERAEELRREADRERLVREATAARRRRRAERSGERHDEERHEGEGRRNPRRWIRAA
ncbi:hypothetical protein V1L54_04320 [Streptomyces sp. TRM 70361]|uniref:hypothetical protein n=1 Tax=Streptomyces sp. TRM 70361 TaxID=3116553 RepID=UPI002E7C3D00|nr:hypothetical protein [Streptomyces sp. TRM 70361]MEE1938642.1 hypothetical protein [Streptomyces sp. TRM 70361]